ncbi:FUSC family protein [Nonomuraea glycinis]|uniref:Integral membrane bound transporter domain-containing protein n=1 Tax=Nonomuraea glycinis TaxID=2047744 RepID=A0A918A1B2_9ACTN|nr:FUSC family protein [Nonomuraea glycinis]MCA2182131.1 FUSC family protein [Nonomuraea glycinis]GGP02233.1 hypothetical protein GCM10012278_08650 [Nonomuraea glycinis]
MFLLLIYLAVRALLPDSLQEIDELATAMRLLGPRVVSPTGIGATPYEPAAPRTAGRCREADLEDRRRGTTRQALRVTAASTLSILGGHLSSPDHCYWAVMATWVVFINTESTGEVLLQSARRVAGTVLGVVFGYGLATLAGPYGPLLLVLLLACMFGMFYTPADAYWAVTFFITGMLSMLLALLDTFSTAVLVLRVQETALGVTCGVLATVVVAPLTVRRSGDEGLVRFLLALSRLLDATTRSPSTGTTTSLICAAHDLDWALDDEYATRVTAAADRAQGRATCLIRLARRRRRTASHPERPKITGALSLLSGERRTRRGPLSPQERPQLHLNRIDLILTELTRAFDPPVPPAERVGTPRCAQMQSGDSYRRPPRPAHHG